MEKAFDWLRTLLRGDTEPSTPRFNQENAPRFGGDDNDPAPYSLSTNMREQELVAPLREAGRRATRR